MAGWLAELEKKKQLKKGIPSSFVVNHNTESIFLIIGAKFDMETGSLTYRMLKHGSTIPTVVSEDDLKSNFRFVRVK